MRFREWAMIAACAAAAACAPTLRKAAPGQPLPTLGTLKRAEPASVEMSPRLPATLDSIMTAGIAGGAAPGAELAVGRYGRIVYEKGFGVLDAKLAPTTPNDSTLWDLASVTKVVGTTTAAMILEDEGKLDIDRPVHDYLPEFNAPDKAGITVRMLLEHRGGLEAFAPLYRDTRGLEAYLRKINASTLIYTPGDSSVYSDWDFVLMGAIVQRLSGMAEDRFLEERVWGPLGMKDTQWNPLMPPGAGPTPPDTDCTALLSRATPQRLARIAPTEIDTIYRHRHIWGIVHDENACALGGVAGHAGLFSSIRDLSVFAQMMLNGGTYGGVRLIRPTTVARWTARQNRGSSRAIGWDTPSPFSSAGRYFSPRSFGHTGFTGTSLWMDPERGVFVILLSNRVDPTRANMKIAPLRRAVADAVQASILDASLVQWRAR